MSSQAISEIVYTQVGSITKIAAYDDYTTYPNSERTDVALWMTTGIGECPHGGYIAPTAQGYDSLVAFALSAYLSKLTVRLQLYDDKIWGGSQRDKLCEIDAITVSID